MSLDIGYGGWQQAKRRQRRRALVRLVLIVAMIGAGVYVYDLGQAGATKRIIDLETEIGRLVTQAETLQQQTDILAGQAESNKVSAEQWKARFEAEVPAGEARGLLAQMKKQLDSGVPAERLGLLIQAAGKPPKCAGNPVSKRFLVKTPIAGGGNDSVTFADNAITVTALGDPAVDDGKPHAWFDPAKPVTVRFVRLGGQAQEVSGVLPLHASLPVDGAEMRVSLIRGEAQGFIRATAEKCELPEGAAK
jgi:hypothetical protein